MLAHCYEAARLRVVHAAGDSFSREGTSFRSIRWVQFLKHSSNDGARRLWNGHGYNSISTPPISSFGTTSTKSHPIWKAKSGDMEDNWIRWKTEVLSIPVGHMTSKDWNRVILLCTSLRGQESWIFADERRRRERIEDAFTLLDRLATEHDLVRSRQQRQRKPLEQGVLVAVLLAWRDYIVWIMNTSLKGVRNDDNNAVATKEQRISSRQRSSQARFMFGSIAPNFILPKVDRYLNTGLVEISPNPFNIILHVMTHMDGTGHDLTRAGDDIFESMVKRSATMHYRFHPTELTVRMVVELWAATGYKYAPSRAQQYLNRLKSWYQQSAAQKDSSDPSRTISPRRPEQKRLQNDLKPTASLYCALIEAYCRSERKQVQEGLISSFGLRQQHRPWKPRFLTEKLPLLYKEMKEICFEHEFDEVIYTRLCNALAQLDPNEARHALDSLVEKVLEKQKKDTSHVFLKSNSKIDQIPIEDAFSAIERKPLQHAFTTVITAYGRHGRYEEAQKVFDQMQILSEQIPFLEPDVVSYNALIWAYARAGQRKQAEAVLQQMIQKNMTLDDSFTWNGILRAYAHDEFVDPGKATKYFELLINMLQTMVKEGTLPKHVLNVSLYNTVLRFYACQTKHPQGGAEAAQELFNYLLQQQQDDNFELKPDADSYLYLELAYQNSRNPQQCEKVLQQLCDLSTEQSREMPALTPTPFHFNVAMEAWSEAQCPGRAQAVFDSMKKFGVKPNVVNYNTLLWAWARWKRPQNQVEQLYAQLQREGVSPDEITHHAVLFEMLKKPPSNGTEDPIYRAESFFREEVIKNAESYTTLMAAWARRNRPDKVEALFQELKKEKHQQRQHVLFPAYITLLQSWSKVGDPERTAAVLQEMIENYELGALEQPPGTHGFNAVLQAWLRSNRPESAIQAEAALRQMSKMTVRYNCSPDAYSYTTVLSAYAKSQSPEAGKRALEVLREFEQVAKDKEKSYQPNLISYTEVILALLRSSVKQQPRKEAKNEEDPVILVKDLLVKLQTKPDLFGAEIRVHDLMKRIREELRNFCKMKLVGSELMEEFSRLEAVTEKL